jgi:hypothetical protein
LGDRPPGRGASRIRQGGAPQVACCRRRFVYDFSYRLTAFQRFVTESRFPELKRTPTAYTMCCRIREIRIGAGYRWADSPVADNLLNIHCTDRPLVGNSAEEQTIIRVGP